MTAAGEVLCSLSQRECCVAGKHPEGREELLALGHRKAVQKHHPLSHGIEGQRPYIQVQVQTNHQGLRRLQHSLLPIVPDTQLRSPCLQTPGHLVPAEPALCPCTLNIPAGDAYTPEALPVVVHLPVMPPTHHPLEPQHLGAVGEALRGIRVWLRLLSHRQPSEAVSQYKSFVGSAMVKGHSEDVL